jgi:hypothetical protein
MIIGRADFHVLSAGTLEPRLLARFYARCVLRGHDVDLQLSREGCHAWDYIVTLTELAGDVVADELSLPVRWDEIDDAARYGLLSLYCSQLLAKTDRSRRRSDVAVRAALRAAKKRLGMPVDG